jgi:hypothetical protein
MSQEKLALARELMAKGDYYAARAILEKIADHPQAVGLLSTIDQIAPKGKKRKRSLADLIEDDPYNQEQFLRNEEPVFVKRKSSALEGKDYTLTAFFILIAYWAFWPIGFITNIMQLGEARRLQEHLGYKPKGLGCLWMLLIFNLVTCAGIISIIYRTLQFLDSVDIFTGGF